MLERDFTMQTADGQMRIKSMIRDDIAEALREGDLYRAALLKNVLRHFIEIHPPTTN